MTVTPAAVEDPLRTAVRGLTLLGALLAYGALAGYVLWETWAASTAPTISNVQGAALGALAVALGAGYASILGVPPKTGGTRITGTGWEKVKAWLRIVLLERTLLGAGVILYMLAGGAMCLTYAFNEAQTPSIVKTVAVAFGGYVIAYIGAAYERFGTQ
jgi:hypothetical protein